MTTRSTILFAFFLTFIGLIASSCNKEKAVTIDITRPFEPALGVDSIYWEKHTQPTLINSIAPIAQTKVIEPLMITTPNAVQIVVENTTASTIYGIDLWAQIQGIDEKIRIAYLDKIPPSSTQIFAPTFIHHKVYLPCASNNVVQLFLPSIIQGSNITITYYLNN